ncbi:MAG TPA: hypothetical protein V6D19_17215 [Stenomitos sp.]
MKILKHKGLWSYLVFEIFLIIIGPFIAVPMLKGSAHSFQEILDYWISIVLRIYLIFNPNAAANFSTIDASRVLFGVGVAFVALLGLLTLVLMSVNSWLERKRKKLDYDSIQNPQRLSRQEIHRSE